MNNLTKRIIFGAIYIAIVILATTTTNYAFALIFGAFMLFCTYEFNKMNKVKSAFPYLINITLFTSGILSLFIQNFEYTNKITLLLILFISLNFIFELKNKQDTVFKNLGHTFISNFYIGLPFILLTLIQKENQNSSVNIILGVFILLWVNDSFAYLVGKNFGKRKLFERISPKKTVEGFIGGLIFTLITGLIIAKYNPNYVNEHFYLMWIIIALIISIFGTIGDLIESMFKRQAKIKDSSNLIPGHGGFLDRLDSFIFVIPFIFIYLNLFS